ncbi:MAG TPA: hypothetical protein VJC16_04245 [Candidatus Nanoarchaeia archaeon]|nr:hypothetical protein [Candidatus Nanoarchaeia archaeon]
MTSLIACLGADHHPHLRRLIAEQQWEQVYLIAAAPMEFAAEKPLSILVVSPAQPVQEYIAELLSRLQGKIPGFEVALNLVSGSGKEHMGIVAACLKLGLGIRLVAVTREGISELS